MIRRFTVLGLMAILTLAVLTSGFSQGDTVPAYFANAWLCLGNSAPRVDDYTTAGNDQLQCQMQVDYTSADAVVHSNGIPNHDFESTLGCCVTIQSFLWIIPLHPTPDTDGQLSRAPERGPVAIAVNGAAIYGPEDGPGGDAVALENGLYQETRQRIHLGICGGHSGPGGIYHYHWDANCLHWHPDEARGQKFSDYSFAQLLGDVHSPIIGFAFDGYPIYGIYGWDGKGQVKEMTSSYRLKANGGHGYNGIDDWEYVAGLGDLDECNGHFAPTPEMLQGIYHYHTTRRNGEGGLGFPYFLLCYHGVADERNLSNVGGPPPR